MEWKVKEGEPFPVGLGPDSPMERMRVPLYIRQGGQAMDRGLYRWELNRGQSFLTAVKGLASEERENHAGNPGFFRNIKPNGAGIF